MGGTAAHIDMEHALILYAQRCGVNIDELPLLLQPDTGEQALEIAETPVRSGAIDNVIDSRRSSCSTGRKLKATAWIPMGVQARLMSQALRKLSGAISQTKTAVIFTNQLRQKIGVMFGNPETTTGGMAFFF